ncbi:hypothetical protein [Rhodanobacter sp. BL-MT-08]
MRVKHWLIGCAICFAGIGGAAATSVDSRELDGSLHGAADSSSTRDSGNSSEPGASETPPARDSTTHGSELRKGASGGGSTQDHSGIDVTPPAHVQQTHLGWQSLLPGSIQ